MKISVVLATYNGEKFILKQLDSILNQTRLPDEIIIVDDCSTDSTFQIINDFINQKRSDYSVSFKLYQNQQNLGFAKNFKNALSFASGSIIVLSDQDDIFVRNKIDVVENFFDSNNQMKIFISSYQMINEYDKVISGIEPFSKNKMVTFNELIKGNSYPGCTIAFRSELRNHFDQFNDAFFAHDWFILLLTSLNYHNSIYYNNVPLVNYRMHSGNTLGINYENKVRFSLNDRIEGIKKTIKFLNSIRNILEVNSTFAKEINSIEEQNSFNNYRIKFLEGKENFFKVFNNISKYLNLKMFLGDINYRIKKPK
jgi:glycosyltransferase involved in cell wall biosynthesis